jgi:uncharacterized Zn-finger protein
MPVDVPETEIVERTRIACDGGGGALGHPRVWLSIDETTGYVECGYCDKRFILKGGPADPDAKAS